MAFCGLFLLSKIHFDSVATMGFILYQISVIIELDGSQHYEEKGLLKDRIRTERIEKRNLTVMRIPNNEVNRNFEGVCQYIDIAVKESLRQSATDTSL